MPLADEQDAEKQKQKEDEGQKRPTMFPALCSFACLSESLEVLLREGEEGQHPQRQRQR